jgi:uroporphyrin-III C-methyltransferase
VARLRAADLVLFDALVDQRVLDLARRAQRFFVGKRAGRPALSQRDIHALMIRAARRGRRVVRLKGGDPFVFGRGGEEAMALSEAGVPFEVVPGVSSVLAGPAMAGIPVTHRGVSSSVFVTSGHDEDVFARAIEGLQCANLTLVIAMGYARRGGLARRLLDAGWPATTPAAIVASATMPEAQVWRGSLAELVSCDGIRVSVPALIVVGEVAAMALLDTMSAEGESVPSDEATAHADRVSRSDHR